MAKTHDYGLGEYTFPRGWFMVAEAAQLHERPLSLRYFGRDLVLFRGRESGKPVLLDAYCPHMGTHLGTNTTSYVVRDGVHIEGDAIRCPYHGWRFRADGRCDDIPRLRGPIPKAACVRSWKVAESLGIVWVWYDEEGLKPQWPAPELAEWSDPAWVHWKVDHLGTLPVHGQEIVDNIVDMAHFGPIHGLDRVEFFENEFDGHLAIQRMVGPHRTLVDGGDKLHTDTTYHGPGYLLSHMRGRHPSIILIANTPVDDGVSCAWHALLVKSAHAEARAADVAVAREFQEASRLAFAQDFEVWAHKAPALKILQVNCDGPFHLERIWYRQFFNPRARAGEFQHRVNGLHRIRGPALPQAAAGA
ncbi:MAG: Rieske (2Fe-2S) protein [Proteobacteria bacterium]|nr:Rieske (2Fe-2S) protein [Pseudomonadota bacterium]